VDPSPGRAPVAPAFAGRETIEAGGVRFTYVIGREFIQDALRELLLSRAPLAVDIETEGLGAAALNLKSVTIGDEDTAIVCDPRDEFQRDLIQRSITFARDLLFWNAAYDVPNLARNGLLTVADCEKITDGVLYARLAEPDELVRKGLTDSWARYTDGPQRVGHVKATDENKAMFRAMGAKNKVEGFLRADLHMPAFVHAAALDVIRTARLVPLARKAAYRRLTTGHPYGRNGVTGDEAWALVERENRMNRILLRRSVRGLRVDLEFLDRYREENQGEIDENTAVLNKFSITPTNSNSLIAALEKADAIPEYHPKTKTGKWSTQAAHLEKLNHPLATAFVRRKKLVKNDEDYLAKVVDLASSHDRIHPQVNLLGATTGRMSMGSPPIQQFPKPARGIILADEGDELTSIDWSQIEPVIAANLAGDIDVIERYEDPSVKADMYTPVAEKAGLERKAAKTILLGILYGLGMDKLANDLECSVEEAYELRRQVFRAMPHTAKFIRRMRDKAEKHMKIMTISGRIIPIPMGTFNGKRSVQTHKGINYPVQGSAYDLLAENVVAVEEAGYGDAIYLCVHDELVVSTCVAHDIRKIMEQPPERLCRLAGRTPILRTDLEDLGERWAAPE
jgi:DNA polymerase-1